VTHTTGERLWIGECKNGHRHWTEHHRRDFCGACAAKFTWQEVVPAADLARAEAEIKELLRLIDDDTQDFKHRVDVVQAVHKAAALAKGGDESA
jgi:hypothetical protein